MLTLKKITHRLFALIEKMLRLFKKIAIPSLLFLVAILQLQIVFDNLNQSASFRTYKVSPSIVRLSIDSTIPVGTGFRFEYKGRSFIGTAAHVCQYFKALKKDPFVSGTSNNETQKILMTGVNTDACIISNNKEGDFLSLDFKTPMYSNTAYTMGYSGNLDFTYWTGQVGVEIERSWPSMITEPSDFFLCAQNSKLPMTNNSNGQTLCNYNQKFLAANIPVFYGQSGSPLLNEKHQVIGILSMSSSNGSFWTTMEDFKEMLERVTK